MRHTDEMEVVLLGGIIVGLAREPEVVEEAVAGLGPHHFDSAANRAVFEAIVALREAGTAVDLPSVYSQLWATGRYWEAGASTHLAALWDLACLPVEVPIIARLFRAARDPRSHPGSVAPLAPAVPFSPTFTPHLCIAGVARTTLLNLLLSIAAPPPVMQR